MKTHELTGKELDWAVQKVLFARQDYIKPENLKIFPTH